MCFPWWGTSVCCQGVRTGSRVRSRAERRVHSLEPQGTQGEAVASFTAPLCSLLRSQVRKQQVKRGAGARLLTLALLLTSSGPLQVALLLLSSSVRCKSNITGLAKGLWGLAAITSAKPLTEESGAVRAFLLLQAQRRLPGWVSCVLALLGTLQHSQGLLGPWAGCAELPSARVKLQESC